MTVWKQQRPEWCPHSDCAYRASSQGCICVGELPTPAPHLDDFNTHRLCIAQSCPGDDEWLFKLEINRSDAWGMTRVLDRAFSAQAIEAQRAETAKTGSVEDESAVAESDVPKGSPVGSQIG